MKPLCALVGSLALSAALSAQQMTFAVDRALYPQLGNEVLIPANLDSDGRTREWVQTRVTAQGTEFRGLALRDTLCVGRWFEPFKAVQAVPGDTLLLGFLSTTGPSGLSRFVAFGTRGYYEVAIGYGCEGTP